MRAASAIVLCICALAAPPSSASALVGSGGASGDASPEALATANAGGADADAPAVPVASTSAQPKPAGGAEYLRRPVATLLGVGPLSAGDTPRIRVRIEEPGVASVTARVVVLRVPGNVTAARVLLGRIPTGRTVSVPWPSRGGLPAGQYLVRVHAKDPFNHNLARLAHASGRTTLVVSPAPAPAPSRAPAPTLAPVTPSPATGTVLPGGDFPVAGPHSYGDPFGAARQGYSHQGQDVLAAEGTPVVAPVAGTIAQTSYQAAAAGYYVVEQADDGRGLFFAHCQKGSFGVSVGQRVSPGAPICRVGHTGDATGPHLHFEEWLGGWRVDAASHPVDPLPQLRAWDR